MPFLCQPLSSVSVLVVMLDSLVLSRGLIDASELIIFLGQMCLEMSG